MKAFLSAAVGAVIAVTMVTMLNAPAPDVEDTAKSAPSAAPKPAAAAACIPASTTNLTDEQKAIAAEAVKAADRAKVGDAGAVIIIATGLVESEMRNLNYGDRDSLGYLQQRPSTGWKNPRDVAKASDDFFTEMAKITDWKSRQPGDVAQAVQRSAHPGRYARRIDEARGIVASVRGAKCDPIPASAPPPNTSEKVRPVMAWASSQHGKPYVFGANGPNSWDCSSFSRTAWSKAGVNLPRTAQAQRDWLASGNGTRVPPGQEKPGDLVFWNSYLGRSRIGHVVLVRDPAEKTTWEAMQTCRSGQKAGVDCGVGSWKYDRSKDRPIYEIWRPGK